MQLHALSRRQHDRWLKFSGLLLAILAVAILLSLAAGELWIWPFTNNSPLETQILTELRIPRTIGAVLVGASLAVAGATLQVLLENPLAEPGVIGISGGASLALVAMIFLSPMVPSSWMMSLAAMAGALLFTFILVSMARKHQLSTSRILLVGVALGILSGAVVTWAFYFSDDLNLRQLLYWLMGSVSGLQWNQLTLAIFIIPAIALLCFRSKSLDIMMLGDIQARQLGVDTAGLRWQLILLVSLLVGTSVALAGVIGFIGLIVPHYLRMWLGSENRYLLPLSGVAGAALLTVSDLLARVILPEAELPVGVVTTTIGAPLFIWMLVRRA
ncbi:vitamin B12 ABC transporter permease BtuC [Parasalinivibrio latis]|uniref:vitamin B12 ABC transporter permease BtuC n=1 Tax=Parasalinivibrio latis TaxID=2952610 RepID=UPI0030DEF9C6